MSAYNKIYREASLIIEEIWDEVLFDGEERINCCAIPTEMYDCILEQIAEKLWPYYIVFKQLNYWQRENLISPKMDTLVWEIINNAEYNC